eukprot:TRINITY_DN19453_c0_g1_i1.p1 TRINITY_DN19453_c0_g1~~TRINITY_DN19453_c0_g1_i1.p1  ORF type:complete len:157 (-),score=36.92 TRINITY_DN19453_c0_g1_i1:63-533(-)
MPRLTITNNFSHHVIAKISKDRIIYDQNKQVEEIAVHANIEVVVPVGAGAAKKKMEERNNIQWMELEKPGFTVIDAGRKAVLPYSKLNTSYLTLEINVDGEYIRKVDCQELDAEQSSGLSVTEQGSVEKTKRAERFLGLGRKHHSGHEPTNFVRKK